MLFRSNIDKGGVQYSALERKEMMSPKTRDKSSYKHWVKGIKKRDGNTCQVCGDVYDLQVHHITKNPYGDGITLCGLCHKRLHNGILGMKPISHYHSALWWRLA